VPAESPSLPAVGRELAKAWCTRGGVGFAPPGSRDNSLTSCDQITATVETHGKEGALDWRVINLSVSHMGNDDERYLELTSGPAREVVQLANAHSSGVGGFSHEIAIEKIELHDVYGDSVPEWFAEVTIDVHDSDMGDCALRGSVHRDLVLCSLTEGRFVCAGVPLIRSAYEEKGTMVQSECGKPRITNKGFALGAEVERDTVTLTALKELQRPFTTAVKPTFGGTQDIKTLLARATLQSALPVTSSGARPAP
jgi:hypothetical protein